MPRIALLLEEVAEALADMVKRKTGLDVDPGTFRVWLGKPEGDGAEFEATFDWPAAIVPGEDVAPEDAARGATFKIWDTSEGGPIRVGPRNVMVSAMQGESFEMLNQAALFMDNAKPGESIELTYANGDFAYRIMRS